jgi:hypothetical protein
MRGDAKPDTSNAQKQEGEENSADADVKDLMKMLVRDSKKAAAQLAESTVCPHSSCR